jgi:hypothetical protein
MKEKVNMTRTKLLPLSLFAIALFILASCSITSHPNEKIIIGKWQPMRVEKIVDSSALMAAGANAGDSTVKNDANPAKSASGKKGGGSGSGNVARKGATLDRLAQSEMRATLEINADKTAVKNFPGNPLRATWKMKGKGTRIVAKNKSTKQKFVIDIVDLSADEVIILEHAPVGDLRITYTRIK